MSVHEARSTLCAFAGLTPEAEDGELGADVALMAQALARLRAVEMGAVIQVAPAPSLVLERHRRVDT